jgi:hypothetical protein
MCWSSHVSDDLGVAAVVVDEGHRAGPTASDEEVDEKEDLEGVELSKVSFVSDMGTDVVPCSSQYTVLSTLMRI